MLVSGPTDAAAKGTYFVLELNGGVAEPAYHLDDVGLAYGLAGGATWKIKGFGVRFYLLASLAGRHAFGEGAAAGVRFESERRDIDLYLSHRWVLPVYEPIRVYLEAGLGQRWSTEWVERAAGLGRLTADSSHFLVVVATGITARLSERFSIGLRAEVAPLTPDNDLIMATTNQAATSNRISGFAQLGLHL